MYTDAVTVLKARLHELRAVRGRSAELARRAGVDKSTVSEWVAGKYLPGFDKLTHLASVLGLTLEEFFDLSVPAVPSLKGPANALSPPSVSSPLGAQDWIAHAIVTLIAPLDDSARAEVLAHALTEVVKRVTEHESSSRRTTGRNSLGALHAPRHRTA
jgi:transcriptional regulator with XRE-family HTH domain